MRALAAIGLVLLLSACGGKVDKPAAPADASLRVKHVLDPKAESLYVEGSVWHVRMFDSRGNQIVDRKLTENSVSLPLAEGRYELWSEELPCAGTAAFSIREPTRARPSSMSRWATSSWQQWR
jgi:hypothetical protein